MKGYDSMLIVARTRLVRITTEFSNQSRGLMKTSGWSFLEGLIGPKLRFWPTRGTIRELHGSFSLACTRRDALLIVVQHFLDRPRLLFGQQHIGVGAQRRDFKRFPGQRDMLAATGRFPDLVHDVLRGIRRVAPTPSAELTCHPPLHAAPVPPDRLDGVFAAGADCAAVVTDITLNDDPEARTREWIEKTDRWR